jgi:Mrp family chromosome partitioning ATPase
MTYIVTGYFGSGKTEFSVNLALKLAAQGAITIADLDVVNPYFRSREAARFLSERGIVLASDHLQGNTGQDLPAASFAFLSKIRAGKNVIIDLGGGHIGLRLLASCYDAILAAGRYEFLCVLNLFRPETDSAAKMADYVASVNSAAKIPVTGLVNNGHMLHETSCEHVLKSQQAVLAAAKALDLPLRYTLLKSDIYSQISNEIQSDKVITFNKLLMRENWQ